MVLAALVLAAAWQVPNWLDWNRYRSTVEALATATLGQPVTIRGPISLTLLPQPALTAGEVSVGGNGSADLAFRVAALRLRVGLWSLLAGRVDARELVLHGPDLHIPWPTSPGTLRPRPPAWLAAFGARIEDGRLSIGHLALTGIEARLQTLDTGALTASGEAQFGGHTWHFTARLTASGADGAAGLNATLDGQGEVNGLGANFAGQMGRDGTLVGSISSRGPNLAALLPAPSVPFRADGRLTVGSGLAAVNDLTMQIGGSPASGAAVLRVDPHPRLDIAISASRLDLDAWWPALLRAGTAVAGVEVPIAIDLSAESAQFGGGTLERLRAGLGLAGHRLAIREASARLPGDASVRLTGHIAQDDPAPPKFEGDATLDAPVLPTTIGWLIEAFPGLPLQHFGAALPAGFAQRTLVSAHVTAGGGAFALQRVDGTLNDSSMSGSIGLKRGQPPSLSVDLSFDRLVLDGWLPRDTSSLAELSNVAASLDAELHFSARQAVYAGEQIGSVAVDAAFEAGNIWLRRFEGTVRSAHVLMSATLNDRGQVSEGKLAVTTADATPVSLLLPAAWRATPALWHGPAKLSAKFAGLQDGLAVETQLAVGDARIDADSIFDLRADAWSTAVRLRHPGARRLIASLGLAAMSGLRELPSWIGDGSLSLVAHVTGAGGQVSAQDFDMIAARLHVHGNLSLWEGHEAPKVSGQINVDELVLPLPSWTSNVPLPLGILHGWEGDVQVRIGRLIPGEGPAVQDVSAALSVANNVLRLDQITARFGAGRLSGDLNCNAAIDPPGISLHGNLANVSATALSDAARFGLLSGHGNASFTLAASGFSPSALLATLRGQLDITLRDGSVAGFDLFRLKRAVQDQDSKAAGVAAGDALLNGATGFDLLNLMASISQGELMLNEGRMIGTAGVVHATGDMMLADGTLDVRLAVQPDVPHAPELGIRLTGPIEHPSRTPELSGLARWMADLAR
jgi:uncharacterized protein involved in outer membrane biogenesis